MKQNLFNKLWLRVGMIVAIMTTALSGTAWAETTETLTISSYATANGWTNQAQYLTATVGSITFTATGGGNTGKYYTTDNSWRFYANETAKLTISVPSGSTLVSVKPTFTSKDNGTLVYNNSTVTSASTVSVSGNSAEFTISQSSGSKGKIFFTEIEVTYSTGASSAVATTTTIDATGITNKDVYVGTAAGSLSATVKDSNNETISGASVTWSSSNENVATVASNGTVTLVAAGTTIITASYAGVANQYQSSSAPYELTVTDSTPFSGVIFDATQDTGESPIIKDNVSFACSNGILSNGSEYRMYKNSTTTISTTDGSLITKIEFTGVSSYSASGFGTQTGWTTADNNGTWTGSATSVTFTASGAQVRATLIKVTVEANTNPSFTISNNNEIDYNSTSGSFNFTISNPVDGGTTTVSENVDWISNAAVSGNSVTFNTTANEATTSREGVITLTYTYGEENITKEITVTQAGNPNGPGTENNPYTVAQALAAPTANGVYVTGIISTITEVSTEYGNATYRISDDGTTTNEMIVYRGKYLENANFTSENQIQKGDVVVVTGNLSEYSNANQMAADNYIVSLTRKELSSISLSGTYQTSFVEGSEFSHDGLVVTANYSDNSTADVTAQATFSVPDMTQVGQQTITVTYNEKTATYNITITEAPTHIVTFSVNGVSSTEDFKEGASITFPTNPADINGKTFMGWTTTEITGTTDNAPTMVTSATMGTADVTYYAVFATQEGTGSTTTVTDVLTRETTGVTGNSYSDWSETGTPGAEYAGNSAGGNESIQLRSNNNNSGIVTTTSGGKVKKVTVTWNSNTQKDRTLNVYGSNTAYTAATDLYGDNAGTLVGTIVCGTSTELTINDDYTFVGLRSASGAMYLTSISIDWETGTGASYSGYCTTVAPATESVTVTDAGYATFASDNALDFTNSSIKAYRATVSGSTLSFTRVDVVPAGEGVLLYSASGETTENVPVLASATAWDDDDNVFVRGTGAAVPYADDNQNYVLVKKDGVVGFYQASGRVVADNRAYIHVANGQNVKGFAIDLEDDATGISLMEDGRSQMEDGVIYNLAGQRLNKMQKGINIVNGKKILK